MNMSTKALLALVAVGAAAYGVHRYDKKRKIEAFKKRQAERDKKAA